MKENRRLEKVREEAEKIHSALITKSKEINVKVEEILKSLQATSNKGKGQEDSWSALTKVFESIQPSILKFRNDRKSLSQLFRESIKFYESKFTPLKEQILDPEGGFSKTIKTVMLQQTEVDKIEGYCKAQFEKIKDNVTQHSVSLKSMIDLEKRLLRYSIILR